VLLSLVNIKDVQQTLYVNYITYVFTEENTLTEEIVRINCNLSNGTATKFLKIKKLTGIKQNTEIIRLSINELYNKIGKAEA
jgi:DNA topoisomerase IA